MSSIQRLSSLFVDPSSSPLSLIAELFWPRICSSASSVKLAPSGIHNPSNSSISLHCGGRVPHPGSSRPHTATHAALTQQRPRLAGRRSLSCVMAAAGAGGKRLLMWFRNDLRLHDNPMVHSAVQKVKAKEVAEVVPVYCFDPRTFGSSAWGTAKTGPHRAKFLQESVADLKASLQGIGSDLLVAVAKPEDVLPSLMQQGGQGGAVLTQEECTSEEAAVDAKVSRAIKANGGQLVRLWGNTLLHKDDLPFDAQLRGMPDVFTPFKDKCENQSKVRQEQPIPKLGELPLPSGLPQELLQLPSWDQLPFADGTRPDFPVDHPNAALAYKGGETAALARLKYYLWDTDLIQNYFNIRNGMLGGDYSTKFAAWMAAGCLSPRRVHWEVKKYEQQRGSNKSTYWVLFELIWRDFFRFFALKHGNSIFHEYGVSGKRLQWATDPELFTRWKAGATGMPLVDANMREFASTGFMSNRGRQNVASYLVLDLGVDWRRGADWFEHLLIDYDVASNWGNWVAAAGLVGGRINHFNITKQSKDYDSEGNYIRTWLPELKNVPTSRIHEPWLMSKAEMDQYGMQIGADYPAPIAASRFARPHGPAGAGGGGGRGGRGSGRGGSGGRRGGSGRGMGRDYKKSVFERYG